MAWLQPEPMNWWDVVEDALQEDVGFGDVSTNCLDPDITMQWQIIAQGSGVLCGVGIVENLFMPFASDPEEASLEILKADGDTVERGDVVLQGILPARRALMAERTALNFLMHLSGIATLTATYVSQVEGTEARIVDTRKTLPGIRTLQKYAVRCGGGYNHRMGLYDGAMIKDNHIVAFGSIEKAVASIRGCTSHMTKIEVECESIEQVQEAIDAGADVIMLDNMDPFTMKDAVSKFKGQVIFEASGGISLETVKGVAATGVDLISIGAITHSAPSIPFHMECE